MLKKIFQFSAGGTINPLKAGMRASSSASSSAIAYCMPGPVPSASTLRWPVAYDMTTSGKKVPRPVGGSSACARARMASPSAALMGAAMKTARLRLTSLVNVGLDLARFLSPLLIVCGWGSVDCTTNERANDVFRSFVDI